VLGFTVLVSVLAGASSASSNLSGFQHKSDQALKEEERPRSEGGASSACRHIGGILVFRLAAERPPASPELCEAYNADPGFNPKGFSRCASVCLCTATEVTKLHLSFRKRWIKYTPCGVKSAAYQSSPLTGWNAFSDFEIEDVLESTCENSPLNFESLTGIIFGR